MPQKIIDTVLRMTVDHLITTVDHLTLSYIANIYVKLIIVKFLVPSG